MATDYTRIIDNIFSKNHSNISDTTDQEAYLTLNVDNRTITPGPKFNTLIGTTDDRNTNIITIQAPKTVEDHDIVNCEHKVLKWHNLKSGDKGISDLQSSESEENLILRWLVPVEAFAAAGTVKIALCFYDTDGTTAHIIYCWNSLPYSGLTVGQGMDEISTDIVPFEEIINVDMRSRKISVPSGLNREVGKKGETTLTTLRFRYDRYYQGYDFLPKEEGSVVIYWKTASATAIEGTLIDNCRIISGTPDVSVIEDRSDLIEFDWLIPQNIIDAGEKFEFSICITTNTEAGAAIWYSDTCSDFYVGSTLIGTDLPETEGGAAELYVVNGELLDNKLSAMLNSNDTLSTSPSMTVSDAIAYSIARFMDAGTTIDSNEVTD